MATPQDRVDLLVRESDATVEYDGYNAPDSTYSSTNKTRIASLAFDHHDSVHNTKLTLNRTTVKRRDPNGWTKAFDGTVDEAGLISTIPYGESHAVQAALNWRASSHENEINHQLIERSLSVANHNQWKATVLEESLRYDSYSLFEDRLTGRVGVRHTLDAGATLMASYATAYKTPSLYQLYDTRYGNASTVPEKIRSWEVGVKIASVKMSWFENRITDLIGFDPVTFKTANVPGQSTLKGYEAVWESKWEEKLGWRLDYTRMVKAVDGNGDPLLRRPKEVLHARVDFYPTAKLHCGLQGRYIGSRLDQDYSTWPATTVNTGYVTVVGLVANYDYSKQISGYIKVDNLFDRTYQDLYGYATAGRSGYVGVKANF